MEWDSLDSLQSNFRPLSSEGTFCLPSPQKYQSYSSGSFFGLDTDEVLEVNPSNNTVIWRSADNIPIRIFHTEREPRQAIFCKFPGWRSNENVYSLLSEAPNEALGDTAGYNDDSTGGYSGLCVAVLLKTTKLCNVSDVLGMLEVFSLDGQEWKRCVALPHHPLKIWPLDNGIIVQSFANSERNFYCYTLCDRPDARIRVVRHILRGCSDDSQKKGKSMTVRTPSPQELTKSSAKSVFRPRNRGFDGSFNSSSTNFFSSQSLFPPSWCHHASPSCSTILLFKDAVLPFALTYDTHRELIRLSLILKLHESIVEAMDHSSKLFQSSDSPASKAAHRSIVNSTHHSTTGLSLEDLVVADGSSPVANFQSSKNLYLSSSSVMLQEIWVLHHKLEDAFHANLQSDVSSFPSYTHPSACFQTSQSFSQGYNISLILCKAAEDLSLASRLRVVFFDRSKGILYLLPAVVRNQRKNGERAAGERTSVEEDSRVGANSGEIFEGESLRGIQSSEEAHEEIYGEASCLEEMSKGEKIEKVIAFSALCSVSSIIEFQSVATNYASFLSKKVINNSLVPIRLQDFVESGQIESKGGRKKSGKDVSKSSKEDEQGGFNDEILVEFSKIPQFLVVLHCNNVLSLYSGCLKICNLVVPELVLCKAPDGHAIVDVFGAVGDRFDIMVLNSKRDEESSFIDEFRTFLAERLWTEQKRDLLSKFNLQVYRCSIELTPSSWLLRSVVESLCLILQGDAVAAFLQHFFLECMYTHAVAGGIDLKKEASASPAAGFQPFGDLQWSNFFDLIINCCLKFVSFSMALNLGHASSPPCGSQTIEGRFSCIQKDLKHLNASLSSSKKTQDAPILANSVENSVFQVEKWPKAVGFTHSCAAVVFSPAKPSEETKNVCSFGGSLIEQEVVAPSSLGDHTLLSSNHETVERMEFSAELRKIIEIDQDIAFLAEDESIKMLLPSDFLAATGSSTDISAMHASAEAQFNAFGAFTEQKKAALTVRRCNDTPSTATLGEYQEDSQAFEDELEKGGFTACSEVVIDNLPSSCQDIHHLHETTASFGEPYKDYPTDCEGRKGRFSSMRGANTLNYEGSSSLPKVREDMPFLAENERRSLLEANQTENMMLDTLSKKEKCINDATHNFTTHNDQATLCRITPYQNASSEDILTLSMGRMFMMLHLLFEDITLRKSSLDDSIAMPLVELLACSSYILDLPNLVDYYVCCRPELSSKMRLFVQALCCEAPHGTKRRWVGGFARLFNESSGAKGVCVPSKHAEFSGLLGTKLVGAENNSETSGCFKKPEGVSDGVVKKIFSASLLELSNAEKKKNERQFDGFIDIHLLKVCSEGLNAVDVNLDVIIDRLNMQREESYITLVCGNPFKPSEWSVSTSKGNTLEGSLDPGMMMILLNFAGFSNGESSQQLGFDTKISQKEALELSDSHTFSLPTTGFLERNYHRDIHYEEKFQHTEGESFSPLHSEYFTGSISAFSCVKASSLVVQREKHEVEGGFPDDSLVQTHCNDENFSVNACVSSLTLHEDYAEALVCSESIFSYLRSCSYAPQAYSLIELLISHNFLDDSLSVDEFSREEEELVGAPRGETAWKLHDAFARSRLELQKRFFSAFSSSIDKDGLFWPGKEDLSLKTSNQAEEDGMKWLAAFKDDKGEAINPHFSIMMLPQQKNPSFLTNRGNNCNDEWLSLSQSAPRELSFPSNFQHVNDAPQTCTQEKSSSDESGLTAPILSFCSQNNLKCSRKPRLHDHFLIATIGRLFFPLIRFFVCYFEKLQEVAVKPTLKSFEEFFRLLNLSENAFRGGFSSFFPVKMRNVLSLGVALPTKSDIYQANFKDFRMFFYDFSFGIKSRQKHQKLLFKERSNGVNAVSEIGMKKSVFRKRFSLLKNQRTREARKKAAAERPEEVKKKRENFIDNSSGKRLLSWKNTDFLEGFSGREKAVKGRNREPVDAENSEVFGENFYHYSRRMSSSCHHTPSSHEKFFSIVEIRDKIADLSTSLKTFLLLFQSKLKENAVFPFFSENCFNSLPQYVSTSKSHWQTPSCRLALTEQSATTIDRRMMSILKLFHKASITSSYVSELSIFLQLAIINYLRSNALSANLQNLPLSALLLFGRDDYASMCVMKEEQTVFSVHPSRSNFSQRVNQESLNAFEAEISPPFGLMKGRIFSHFASHDAPMGSQNAANHSKTKFFRWGGLAPSMSWFDCMFTEDFRSHQVAWYLDSCRLRHVCAVSKDRDFDDRNTINLAYVLAVTQQLSVCVGRGAFTAFCVPPDLLFTTVLDIMPIDMRVCVTCYVPCNTSRQDDSNSEENAEEKRSELESKFERLYPRIVSRDQKLFSLENDRWPEFHNGVAAALMVAPYAGGPSPNLWRRENAAARKENQFCMLNAIETDENPMKSTILKQKRRIVELLRRYGAKERGVLLESTINEDFSVTSSDERGTHKPVLSADYFIEGSFASTHVKTDDRSTDKDSLYGIKRADLLAAALNRQPSVKNRRRRRKSQPHSMGYMQHIRDYNKNPLWHTRRPASLIPPDALMMKQLLDRHRETYNVNEFGGILLGLGLNNHLQAISKKVCFTLFRNNIEETLQTGILLGLACSSIGSKSSELKRTSLLHLPYTLPSNYKEMQIKSSIQCSAVLSLGLICAGTGDQLICRTLIEILSKPHVVVLLDKQKIERESFTLCAGWSLGMILLGRVGGSLCVEDETRRGQSSRSWRYEELLDEEQGGREGVCEGGGSLLGERGVSWLGGRVGRGLEAAYATHKQRVFSEDTSTGRAEQIWRNHEAAIPSKSGKIQRNSVKKWKVSTGDKVLCDSLFNLADGRCVLLEGDVVPRVSTSSIYYGDGNVLEVTMAACLALGIAFMHTDDAAAARRIKLPRAFNEISEFSPTLIAIKVLARNLILWSGIKATHTYIVSQLPVFLRVFPFDMDGMSPFSFYNSKDFEENIDFDASINAPRPLPYLYLLDHKTGHFLQKRRRFPSQPPFDDYECFKEPRYNGNIGEKPHFSQFFGSKSSKNAHFTAQSEAFPLNFHNVLKRGPLSYLPPHAYSSYVCEEEKNPQKKSSGDPVSVDASGWWSGQVSCNVALAQRLRAYAIGGVLWAIGLKYAGTGDLQAKQLLIEYLDYFRTIRLDTIKENGCSEWPTCIPFTIARLKKRDGIDASSAQAMITICVQALACVMAGTGDLCVLKYITSDQEEFLYDFSYDVPFLLRNVIADRKKKRFLKSMYAIDGRGEGREGGIRGVNSSHRWGGDEALPASHRRAEGQRQHIKSWGGDSAMIHGLEKDAFPSISTRLAEDRFPREDEGVCAEYLKDLASPVAKSAGKGMKGRSTLFNLALLADHADLHSSESLLGANSAQSRNAYRSKTSLLYPHLPTDESLDFEGCANTATSVDRLPEMSQNKAVTHMKSFDRTRSTVLSPIHDAIEDSKQRSTTHTEEMHQRIFSLTREELPSGRLNASLHNTPRNLLPQRDFHPEKPPFPASSNAGLALTIDKLRDLIAVEMLPLHFVSYGEKLMRNLAVGILCLGGGRCSLKRDKLSIASLMISLYPFNLPSDAQDQKYHLQAARHLYMIAVEKRCLQAIEAVSGKSVRLPVEVDYVEDTTSDEDGECVKERCCYRENYEEAAFLQAESNSEELGLGLAEKRVLGAANLTGKDGSMERSVCAGYGGVFDVGGGSYAVEDEHSRDLHHASLKATGGGFFDLEDSRLRDLNHLPNRGAMRQLTHPLESLADTSHKREQTLHQALSSVTGSISSMNLGSAQPVYPYDSVNHPHSFSFGGPSLQKRKNSHSHTRAKSYPSTNFHTHPEPALQNPCYTTNKQCFNDQSCSNEGRNGIKQSSDASCSEDEISEESFSEDSSAVDSIPPFSFQQEWSNLTIDSLEGKLRKKLEQVKTKKLVLPALLPEAHRIVELRVKGARYWPIKLKHEVLEPADSLNKHRNRRFFHFTALEGKQRISSDRFSGGGYGCIDMLDTVLHTGIIVVKRKLFCLPYSHHDLKSPGKLPFYIVKNSSSKPLTKDMQREHSPQLIEAAKSLVLRHSARNHAFRSSMEVPAAVCALSSSNLRGFSSGSPRAERGIGHTGTGHATDYGNTGYATTDYTNKPPTTTCLHTQHKNELSPYYSAKLLPFPPTDPHTNHIESSLSRLRSYSPPPASLHALSSYQQLQLPTFLPPSDDENLRIEGCINPLFPASSRNADIHASQRVADMNLLSQEEVDSESSMIWMLPKHRMPSPEKLADFLGVLASRAHVDNFDGVDHSAIMGKLFLSHLPMGIKGPGGLLASLTSSQQHTSLGVSEEAMTLISALHTLLPNSSPDEGVAAGFSRVCKEKASSVEHMQHERLENMSEEVSLQLMGGGWSGGEVNLCKRASGNDLLGDFFGNIRSVKEKKSFYNEKRGLKGLRENSVVHSTSLRRLEAGSQEFGLSEDGLLRSSLKGVSYGEDGVKVCVEKFAGYQGYLASSSKHYEPLLKKMTSNRYTQLVDKLRIIQECLLAGKITHFPLISLLYESLASSVSRRGFLVGYLNTEVTSSSSSLEHSAIQKASLRSFTLPFFPESSCLQSSHEVLSNTGSRERKKCGKMLQPEDSAHTATTGGCVLARKPEKGAKKRGKTSSKSAKTLRNIFKPIKEAEEASGMKKQQGFQLSSTLFHEENLNEKSVESSESFAIDDENAKISLGFGECSQSSSYAGVQPKKNRESHTQGITSIPSSSGMKNTKSGDSGMTSTPSNSAMKNTPPISSQTRDSQYTAQHALKMIPIYSKASFPSSFITSSITLISQMKLLASMSPLFSHAHDIPPVQEGADNFRFLGNDLLKTPLINPQHFFIFLAHLKTYFEDETVMKRLRSWLLHYLIHGSFALTEHQQQIRDSMLSSQQAGEIFLALYNEFPTHTRWKKLVARLRVGFDIPDPRVYEERITEGKRALYDRVEGKIEGVAGKRVCVSSSLSEFGDFANECGVFPGKSVRKGSSLTSVGVREGGEDVWLKLKGQCTAWEEEHHQRSNEGEDDEEDVLRRSCTLIEDENTKRCYVEDRWVKDADDAVREEAESYSLLMMNGGNEMLSRLLKEILLVCWEVNTKSTHRYRSIS